MSSHSRRHRNAQEQQRRESGARRMPAASLGVFILRGVLSGRLHVIDLADLGSCPFAYRTYHQAAATADQQWNFNTRLMKVERTTIGDLAAHGPFVLDGYIITPGKEDDALL